MHHYPFHPGDYLLDTAHLEPMHDLAYRRLLDLYYTSERPIPRETQQVSRRLRLDEKVVSDVLNEFFQDTPEGWRHARCDSEIESFRGRGEASRKNGSKGGRPRNSTTSEESPDSSKPKKTQQVIAGFPNETQHGSGSGSWENGSAEGKRVARAELDAWIEKIRDAYPRKGEQQDCRHAIRSALDAAHQTPQQILDDVLACAVWVKQAEEKGTCSWVPCAGAFFGKRQWTDPKKFEGIAIRVKEAQNGNQTHQQSNHSGDLNRPGRYAKKPAAT